MNRESLLAACLDAISNRSFSKAYDQAFTIVKAQTDAEKEKSFQLRYDVFCQESDYTLPCGYGADMECDEYDEKAAHYLLIHKATEEVVGTARYIRCDYESERHSHPLQDVCDHPLIHGHLNRQAGGQRKTLRLGEVSRLCMSSKFRRRERDGSMLPAYYEPELKGVKTNGKISYFRRRIPYAPLGLLRGMFQEALKARTLDLVAAIDPSEFQTLKRLGVDYKVLGPRLMTYGNMQPIVFNLKNVLDTMATENRPCWEIVSDHGRLHEKANSLYRDMWHDGIFEDVSRDEIFQKLF